jgi:hypothetical protein
MMIKTFILVFLCIFVFASALELKTQALKIGPLKLGPRGKVEKMVVANKPSSGRIATKGVKFALKDAKTGEILSEKKVSIHHFALCYDDKFDLFTCPKWNEDFAGTGGEFIEQELPESYFFVSEPTSGWSASMHLINHANTSAEVYVEYIVSYVELAEGPLPKEIIPVRPFRLDMGYDCKSHFMVPGGHKAAANTRTWLAPFSGNVIRCFAHMHEGAISIEANVDNKQICKSYPVGLPHGDDVDMSVCDMSVPVQKGQVIELVSLYDTENVKEMHGMAVMICFITEETYF